MEQDIRTQNKLDTITAKGRVTMKLFNECGQLKQRIDFNNLIVTVGKNFLASWLTTAQAAGFMPYIALGTGTNAPTSGDTTLQTELPTRVLGTLSSAANVFSNVASFGPGVDTGALTETGLFSASSGGTMFARQVFGVINKSAGDTLQVTWQVTFS